MFMTTGLGRVSRAAIAGLAPFVLSVSFGQAEYGPKTTIGANFQQTSRTLSTDGVTPGTCSGNSSCYVLFQKVPKKKQLIVHNVSCFVVVSAGGLRSAFLWSRDGADVPLKQTVLVPVPTTDSGFWLINSPAAHLLKSRERPFIFLTGSTNANWTNVFCNISGELKKP